MVLTYQLRDMAGRALYHGATRPRYDEAARQWITATCTAMAQHENLYVVVEMPAQAAPTENRTLTHVQYMGRFSAGELEALYGAAAHNIAVHVWLKKFELADNIWLDDPMTVQGLNDMEASGLLEPGRAAEIAA